LPAASNFTREGDQVAYTVAQLTDYYTATNFGQAPDAATVTSFTQAIAQAAAGAIADQQVLALALQSSQVRATTDVAVAVYQYFNGSAPSQAGLNYLLNTAGSGLNTTYYNGATGTASSPSAGGFNLENRYYNLAISQAFQGPNAAAFASTYGALTLQATVAQAYEQIVGVSVVGASQVAAAVAAIQGSIPFFQQVAAARATGLNQDLATKAIIVGYILEESIKAGVGAYALALDQHHASIANNTAVYNANILTAYAPGAATYGKGVGGGIMPVYLVGTQVAQQRVDLPTGSIVNLTGALGAGLTLQLRDASGSTDTLSLGLYGNGAAQGTSGAIINGLSLGGTAVAGSIEILNVVSGGLLTTDKVGNDNILVLAPATAPNIVNISGSQAMTVATGAVTHNILLDGTAATGGLALNGSATVAAGVAVNLVGGAANDTLVAGLSTTAVAQTVYGGKGGDAILLGGGILDSLNEEVAGGAATHKPIDTLVYKAVTDSLFSDDSQAGSTRRAMQFASTTPMDAVFGFVSGQDKIDVKALGMTQAELVIADKGSISDLAGFNALVTSGNFYKDSGGVTRRATIIHAGPDTYLFIDVNHNGAYDATGDLAVKFVGIPTIANGDLIGV
jgi:S-layer protein